MGNSTPNLRRTESSTQEVPKVLENRGFPAHS